MHESCLVDMEGGDDVAEDLINLLEVDQVEIPMRTIHVDRRMLLLDALQRNDLPLCPVFGARLSRSQQHWNDCGVGLLIGHCTSRPLVLLRHFFSAEHRFL